MNKINFIYFDVGGVVIRDFSDTNNWIDMLKSMGVNETNQDRFNQVWNKHKDRICIDYDVDFMIEELREFVGLNLNDNFSFLNEFINRFDINTSIWPIIAYAKQNYKIGLLTGMYPRMLNGIMNKPDLMPKVDWDIIVDSSVVKMQKPNPEIYDLAMKLSGVKDPNEILFVDNGEANLTYPNQLGWQTFLYDTKNTDESSKQLFNRISKPQ